MNCVVITVPQCVITEVETATSEEKLNLRKPRQRRAKWWLKSRQQTNWIHSRIFPSIQGTVSIAAIMALKTDTSWKNSKVQLSYKLQISDPKTLLQKTLGLATALVVTRSVHSCDFKRRWRRRNIPRWWQRRNWELNVRAAQWHLNMTVPWVKTYHFPKNMNMYIVITYN